MFHVAEFIYIYETVVDNRKIQLDARYTWFLPTIYSLACSLFSCFMVFYLCFSLVIQRTPLRMAVSCDSPDAGPPPYYYISSLSSIFYVCSFLDIRHMATWDCPRDLSVALPVAAIFCSPLPLSVLLPILSDWTNYISVFVDLQGIVINKLEARRQTKQVSICCWFPGIQCDDYDNWILFIK